MGGKGRIKKIESHDFVSTLAQSSNETFPEVASTSGYEYAHSV